MTRGEPAAALLPIGVCGLALALTVAAAGQTYDVSGVVIQGVTGAPIAKVTLSLAPATDRDNILFAVLNDAEGRFHLTGVPAGRYSLSAQRNGYRTQRLNQHGSLSSALIVGPNSDTSQVVFQMQPTTNLSVMVMDEENQPVRNAQVRLIGKHVVDGEVKPYFAGAQTTSDSGRAFIPHLSPGTYYAAVTATPWYAARGQTPQRMRQRTGLNAPSASLEASPSPLDVAYPITWYGGASDFSGAAPIMVTQGAQPSVMISLQPVACVHVRIPVNPNAGRSFVQVMSDLPGGFRTVVNASRQQSSEETLLGLAPGRYVFEIRDVFVGNADSAKSARPANSHAFIKADVTGDMTLSPSGTPTVSLTGKASADASLVPEGVHLGLVPDGGEGEAVALSLDENLNFQNPAGPILPGRYRLQCGKTGTEVTSVAMNGQPAKVGNIVTLLAGEVSLVVTLGQHQMAEAAGIVTQQDQPRAGVPIYLIPADGKNPSRVFLEESDSDGSFSVKVNAGKYIGVAIENGWDLEYAKPDVMTPYLAGGTEFEVKPDGKVQVKLEVQPRQ